MSGPPNNLISLRVADAQGYIANADCYFTCDPASYTVDQLLAIAATFLADVQACSGGRIVEAQVRIGIDVSSWAAKPIEVGAVITDNLALSFKETSGSLPWDFLVPAVSTTVIAGSGPDMTEGATIDTLGDLLENSGPTYAGFTFLSNRGGVLGPTAGGFLATWKRGKQRQRKSVRIGY